MFLCLFSVRDSVFCLKRNFFSFMDPLHLQVVQTRPSENCVWEWGMHICNSFLVENFKYDAVSNSVGLKPCCFTTTE